jgi:hypothetical protein
VDKGATEEEDKLLGVAPLASVLDAGVVDDAIRRGVVEEDGTSVSDGGPGGDDGATVVDRATSIDWAPSWETVDAIADDEEDVEDVDEDVIEFRCTSVASPSDDCTGSGSAMPFLADILAGETARGRVDTIAAVTTVPGFDFTPDRATAIARFMTQTIFCTAAYDGNFYVPAAKTIVVVKIFFAKPLICDCKNTEERGKKNYWAVEAANADGTSKKNFYRRARVHVAKYTTKRQQKKKKPALLASARMRAWFFFFITSQRTNWIVPSPNRPSDNTEVDVANGTCPRRCGSCR